GLKPGENLINQRTKDAAIHEEFLRAKILVRANLPEAIRLLNDVVQREPDFAPAWGVLARAYDIAAFGELAVGRGAVAEAKPILASYFSKASAAANRAYTLDPDSSDAVYALGDVKLGAGDQINGMALVERALALDPDNPEPLQTYSLR